MSNNNFRISLGRMILMVMMLMIVVVGGTFAWLTFSSKQSALVLTIGNINNTQITLSPYQIKEEGMTPVNTYTSGVSSNVTVVNGERSNRVTLFYKINELDTNLINNGLKYTIVNIASDGTETHVKTGDFTSFVGKDEAVIYDGDAVKNSTTNYKVYLWVDSSGGNQNSIAGSTIDVELNGAIGSVKISGTNTYGETLVANITDFDQSMTGDAAPDYTYQWYHNSTNSTSGGTKINGATSRSYTIGEGLVGKYIYVVVTVSRAGYDGRTYVDITDATDESGDGDYSNSTATVKCKDITEIIAASATKVYDGEPLTNNNCSATGLLSGHTINCTMTNGSTITNAGNVANVIDKFTIKKGDVDVTNNYCVNKKTDGKLTVTKDSCVCTISDDYTNTLIGPSHTPNGSLTYSCVSTNDDERHSDGERYVTSNNTNVLTVGTLTHLNGITTAPYSIVGSSTGTVKLTAGAKEGSNYLACTVDTVDVVVKTNQYTVNYYSGETPNGNYTLLGNSTHIYGSTADSNKLKTGTTLGIPTSTLTTNYGWTLAGWSKTQDSTTVDFADGALANITEVDGATINLYAVYTRTITLYSGKDSATTDGTRTQKWNRNTIDSVKSDTPVAISKWSSSGYRHDTTAGTQQYNVETVSANITPSYNVSNKLYAVYSRTLTFKSGIDDATTDGTRIQYYNSAGTLGSVNSYTPVAINNGWTALGYRDDDTAGEKEYASGTSTNITPAIDNGANTLYAVYSRTLTFVSGINKATTDGTRIQYYNSADIDSTKTGENVSSIKSYTPVDIDYWSALGYRDDTVADVKEYNSGTNTDIMPALTSSTTLYAVYSRIIKAYSGVNKATTHKATRYYNSYDNITSLTLPTTTDTGDFDSKVTVISDWIFEGWRADEFELESEMTIYDLSVSSFFGKVYAVYSRSHKATFYSGVNKANSKEISGTAYYNTNISSLPTGVTITAASAADCTDITGWTELGWRDDATTGDKEIDFESSLTLTFGTTYNYYAVYGRTHKATFYSGVNKASNKEISNTAYYNTNTSATPTSVTITAASAADCADITGWTCHGWRDDTTTGDKEIDFESSLTLTFGTTYNYYAMYSRTHKAIFYSGINKASNKEKSAVAYYNSGVSTLVSYVSILAPTAADCTDISDWTELGWRDDSTTGDKEVAFGAALNLSFDTTYNYYAVYSRSHKATFYSGINKANNKEISGTAYYNTNASTTPTSVTITAASAADCTDISDWEELGWRNDTTKGDKEIDFGSSLTLTFGTTYNYYAVYKREVIVHFYHGINKEIKDTTRETAYYNTNDSSLPTDIYVEFPSTATNINGWNIVGWKGDEEATETSIGLGDWHFLSFGTKTYYAIYERIITAYSGIDEPNEHYAIQYYNSSGNISSLVLPTVDSLGSFNIDVASPSEVIDSMKIPEWTLNGWRDDTDAAAAEFYDNYSPAVNSSTTLYAVYDRTLTVSYNGNGNTGGSTADTTKTVYMNTASTTTSSQEVTLASSGFTRTGYVFIQWAAGSASGTQYLASSKYNPNLAYYESSFNITMYAKWGKTVVASFVTFGGHIDNPKSCIIPEDGTSCTITAPSPAVIPDNYEFYGWATGSSPTYVASPIKAGDTFALSADTQYSAIYSIERTATFRYSTLSSSNYTYTGHEGTTITAKGTEYMSITGAKDVSTGAITIPTVVTSSTGGAAAETYAGLANSTSSSTSSIAKTATTVPASDATYYAVYSESLMFYYMTDGGGMPGTSRNRYMLFNGTNYNISLSSAAPVPTTYYGADFEGWSYTADEVNDRNPLETGVNALYAYYQKDITLSYDVSGGDLAILNNTGTRTYITQIGDLPKELGTVNVSSITPKRKGYTFEGWSMVPSEYQEVSYIQSSGTQYIDTGYAFVNEDIKIVLNANVTSNSSSQSLFGNEEVIDSSDNRYFSGVPFGSGGKYNIYIGNSGSGVYIEPGLNTDFVMSITTNTDRNALMHKDGTKVGSKMYSGSVITKANAYTTSTTATNVGNIFLFANRNSQKGTVANNTGTQVIGGMKVYSFQLYDGGVLVRNMIPCYRKSDNVIGMYDTVTGNFYTNIGTGTFTKGNNVNYLSGKTFTQSYKLYANWTANTYTVGLNYGNLIYNLNDIVDTTSSRIKYSVSNKIVTATNTSGVLDGYGYINARVDLKAGTNYKVSAKSTGTWGTTNASPYVEMFLMKDGSTTKIDGVNPYVNVTNNIVNNTTFTVPFDGTYWIRLDVNGIGDTFKFYDISIVEATNRSTVTVTYGSSMPNITVPTRDGYVFEGYYADITPIAAEFSVSGSSNQRIDLLKDSNGWGMTTALDSGTNIKATIIVDSTTQPNLQFNDVPLIKGIDYTVTYIDPGSWCYRLNFNIDDNMVSKRGNYDYETQYRFIDIEGISNDKSLSVLVNKLYIGGGKYYEYRGVSTDTYDIAGSTTLYANWEPSVAVNYYVGDTKVLTEYYPVNKSSSLPAWNNIVLDEELTLKTNFNKNQYGWTFATWSTSNTSATRNHITSITPTSSDTINLYAVFSRTLKFYSGVNKSTTDGRPLQYYNMSGLGYVSSVNSYQPTSITNFESKAYKIGTTSYSLGVTNQISPAWNKSPDLYAYYVSSKTIDVFSGPNDSKKISSQKCSVSGGYTSNTATLPTKCTFTFPAKASVASLGNHDYTGWTALGFRDDSDLSSTVEYSFGSSKEVSLSSSTKYYAIYSRTVYFISGDPDTKLVENIKNQQLYNTGNGDQYISNYLPVLTQNPENLFSYKVSNDSTAIVGVKPYWQIYWKELGYECYEENENINFTGRENTIDYAPYLEDVVAPRYSTGNYCYAIYTRRFQLVTGISGSNTISSNVNQYFSSKGDITQLYVPSGTGIANMNDSWKDDIASLKWSTFADGQSSITFGITPPRNLGYSNDTRTDEWRNDLVSYGCPIPIYAIYERTITFKSGVSAGTENKTESQKYISYGLLEGVTTPTSMTAIGTSLGGSTWSPSGWTNGTGAVAGDANGTKIVPAVDSTATTYYGTYYRNIRFNDSTSRDIPQYYNSYSGNVSSVTRPSLTAATGWAALGWRDDATAFTKEYDAGSLYIPEANASILTQYGIYRRVITFKQDNFVATDQSVYQYRRASTRGSITAPSSIYSYSSLPVENPIPIDWTFVGWRDDTTAGNKEVNPGGTVTPGASVTTYYAVYSREIKAYSGPSGSMTTHTGNQYLHGTQLTVSTLTLPSLTAKGSFDSVAAARGNNFDTLVGWNLDYLARADYTTTYQPQYNATYTEVYAVYSRTATVYSGLASATSSSGTQYYCSYDGHYEFDLAQTTITTPTGYELYGLHEEPYQPHDITDVHDPHDQTYTGSSQELWGVYRKQIKGYFGFNKASSKTGWMLYHAGEGETFVQLSSPGNLTNWTFSGWRDDTTAGAKELNASSSDYQWTFPSSTSSNWYAVYTRNRIIQYNANGGSGAPSQQTKVVYMNTNSTSSLSSQTITLSSTKPTKSGYTFLGWNTNASATTASFTAGSAYTNTFPFNASSWTTTLYAIYAGAATPTSE